MRRTVATILLTVSFTLATLWVHDLYVQRRDTRGTMIALTHNLQRRGPDGRDGTKLVYCGEWSADLVPYHVGDAVSRKGTVYYVVRTNSIDPSTDKDGWYWGVIGK